MVRLGLVLFFASVAAAQFPPAQLTGVLLERDGGVAAGQFAVRAPDHRVYRFQFDAQTAAGALQHQMAAARN